MLKLFIVFFSGIVSALAALTYKFRHRHGFSIDVLLLYFSLFFTLLTLLCILIFREPLFTPRALFLGLCSGLIMGTVIRFMFIVTYRVKLNISWTVIQYSVLIPFLLSLVLFREKPQLKALFGAGCIFVSILFFGLGKSKAQDGPSKRDVKTGLLMFLCSFLTGIMFSIPKLYLYLEPRGGTFTLLLYSGVGMIPLASIVLFVKKNSKTVLWAAPGLLVLALYMGITNVGAIALLMIALQSIEGSIVFPLRTVVNVLSIFLLTFILFREKPSFLEAVGVLIALTGLVLVIMTMR